MRIESLSQLLWLVVPLAGLAFAAGALRSLGLRQPDPPALPTGQPADPDRGLVREPDRVEHPANLRGAGLAVVPLLEDGEVLDEAEGGHVRGVAELLG